MTERKVTVLPPVTSEDDYPPLTSREKFLAKRRKGDGATNVMEHRTPMYEDVKFAGRTNNRPEAEIG